MKNAAKIKIIILLSLFFWATLSTFQSSFAERIIFKSGNVVEGRIVGRDSENIRIFNKQGFVKTYSLSDIAEIQSDSPPASAEEKPLKQEFGDDLSKEKAGVECPHCIDQYEHKGLLTDVLKQYQGLIGDALKQYENIFKEELPESKPTR